MQPSTKYYLISGYQRVPGHHPCNPQPNTTSSVVNQGYQYTILATLNQILPHQWLPKGTRTLSMQPSTKYYLISGYPRVPGHYQRNLQPNTTSSVVTQGYQDTTHSTLNQILNHQWLPKGTRTLPIQPSSKYYLISGYSRIAGDDYPCNPQPNTIPSVVTWRYHDSTRATFNQILPHHRKEKWRFVTIFVEMKLSRLFLWWPGETFKCCCPNKMGN